MSRLGPEPRASEAPWRAAWSEAMAAAVEEGRSDGMEELFWEFGADDMVIFSVEGSLRSRERS